MGSETRNIAFVENATVAYSEALSSIAFERGDVILTSQNDYVSNQLMFLALAHRFGVEVVRAQMLRKAGWTRRRSRATSSALPVASFSGGRVAPDFSMWRIVPLTLARSHSSSTCGAPSGPPLVRTVRCRVRGGSRTESSPMPYCWVSGRRPDTPTGWVSTPLQGEPSIWRRWLGRSWAS